MQPPSDIKLLQRWHEHQDAHAFRALTQRYGGLVYGICNRVLKNSADAEEITQECFLKLAQYPQQPKKSVGPWLHSVAVRTSLNHIRSEQRRRAREASYQADQPSTVAQTANDVVSHVDEAIESLPDALRHCVVASFLEGKSQSEVAAELNVTTRTVRRKTEEAIDRIRSVMQTRGVGTGTVALTTLLTGLQAEALSPSLGVALGKLALGSKAPSGLAKSWAAVETVSNIGGMGAMKMTGWAVAGLVVVSGSVWWGVVGRGAAKTESAPPSIAAVSPETVQESPPPIETAPIPPNAGNASPSDSVAPPETVAVSSSLRTLDQIPKLSNPTHYARVSGVVLDEAQRPIPYASVTLLVAGFGENEADQYRADGLPESPIAENTDFSPIQRQITLQSALEAQGHVFSSECDEKGVFLLANLPYSGKAMVLARADDLEGTPETFQLEAGTQIETTLIMRPAKTIRGQVNTAEGTPVIDATVMPASIHQMQRQGSRGGGGSSSRNAGSPATPAPFLVKTDQHGQFTLPLADADQATLRLESDTLGTMIAHNIPVGSGSIETLVWESDQGALAGRILHQDETPAAHYIVHITGQIRGSDSLSSQETAQSPEPSEIMPSGTYQSRRGGGGGSRRDSSERVTRRGSSGSSSGGSSGGGMTTPFVFPQRPVESKPYFATTDAEGHFAIPSLPVHAAYTATIYDGTGHIAGVSLLPSMQTDKTTPWHFTLQPPLRVTGHVVGTPSGKPLEGINVRRMNLGGPSPRSEQAVETKTGPDGRFELAFFDKAGSYRFVAALDGSGVSKTESNPVDLRHDTTPEITLTLPDPWSRRFRVIDRFGTPITGAQIQLESRTHDGGGYLGLVEGLLTDATGRVLVPNLPPTVEVRIFTGKEGYLDSTSTWADAMRHNTDRMETIVLFARASLSARVLDHDRQAVPNQALLGTADCGDGQLRVFSTSTDEEGWILLDGSLPATDLDLTIRMPAGSQERSHLIVTGSLGMPPHMQAQQNRRMIEAAIDANTPVAYLGGISLSDQGVNELGDIVLVAE